MVFVPLRGMSLKTSIVKDVANTIKEISFRPPSGNEFKNLDLQLKDPKYIDKLVFVPLRGMSLKTDAVNTFKEVRQSERFRPPSGNEFKNPYFFLKFFVKI